MRLRYINLLLVFLLVGYGVYDYPRTVAYFQTLSSTVREIAYSKRISVRGLHTLSADSIQGRLPRDRSVFWWLTNPHSIEALLIESSYIQEAEVSPCGTWISPWGCFVIDIVERSPSFLTTSGNEMIVLGEDGGTITSFPLSELENRLMSMLNPHSRKPKMLVDLIVPGLSSDLLKARFNYLKNAITSIESGASVVVSRIQLLANGEIVARLEGMPFDVQFDSSEEREEGMQEEVIRLRRLLSELRGKENAIKKIDLAFEKIAVVTYTDEYLKEQELAQKQEPKK